MEWYKQSVVSKDSNFDGPTDLFHEYADIPNADMDSKFINNENT
jgi:hypothetical protein